MIQGMYKQAPCIAGMFHYKLYWQHYHTDDYYIQRKFAHEDIDPRSDTFKRFRRWLDLQFTSGSPTEEDWDIIVRDDEAYPYHQSVVSASVQEYELGNDPNQEEVNNNPPMDPNLDFNVSNNVDYVQQN